MPDYGLGLAYGYENMNQDLRQRIMDQLAQKQQGFENEQRLREMALREREAQQRGDVQAEQLRQLGEERRSRVEAEQAARVKDIAGQHRIGDVLQPSEMSALPVGLKTTDPKQIRGLLLAPQAPQGGGYFTGLPAQRELYGQQEAEVGLQRDPNLTPQMRGYLRMRSALPKGENPPADLFKQPPATATPFTVKTMENGRPVEKVMTREQALAAGSFPSQPQSGANVVIHTTDAQGNPVDRIVPKTPGSEFQGRAPAMTQQRMYSARQVSSHFDDVIDEINEADKRGLIGPISGRWSEFMAGGLGSTGNPDNDALLGQLRMDLTLVKSGITMAHFGARGGQQYIQQLNKIIDGGKMSKAELVGALNGAKKWLNTYSQNPNATPAQKPVTGGGASRFKVEVEQP